MMCLKHLLVYTILLPVPAASPLFLALFVAAVFWRERPCTYCLVLYAILFLATSPSSPFVDSHPPADLGILSPSTPMPDRTWLTVNSGKLLEPSLAGYQPTYGWNETTESLPITDGGKEGVSGELPPNHVDWRWKGIGMVVDFGWKRTDEGIRWEKASRGQEVHAEPEDAKSPGGFWGGLVQNIRQGSARWTEL